MGRFHILCAPLLFLDQLEFSNNRVEEEIFYRLTDAELHVKICGVCYRYSFQIWKLVVQRLAVLSNSFELSCQIHFLFLVESAGICLIINCPAADVVGWTV